MKLKIERFLDYIDTWKFKLHEKLKGMSPAQRKAFWHEAHERARARPQRRRAGEAGETDDETGPTHRVRLQ
jgi:hypothetical protein